MLTNRHLTALEAMQFGILLHGKRYFAGLRKVFAEMKRHGLVRDRHGWRIVKNT